MKKNNSKFKNTSQVQRSGNRLRPSMTHTPPKKRDGLFFTLRARLFFLFILVTLVPMTMLSVLNHLSTRKGLENAANRLLLMAAKQTASDIDTFLNHNSQTVTEEARLEELRAYLTMSDEQRKNSLEEEKALETIETLFSKQFILNPYIEAYILLDRNGQVVLASNAENTPYYLPHLGLNNVDPYSYNLMVNAGYMYVSPVLISPDGKTGNLYFASRIVDQQNQTIGVIAAQYNARALQTIIEKNNNIAGSGSYASLYDDKKIRLAHGHRPENLFKSIAALDNSEIVLLRSIRRLPSLPVEDLLAQNPSLADGLSRVYKETPFFKALLEEGSEEYYSGAVAQTDNRSWVVAFLQAQSAFLLPVEQQTQTTLYLSIMFLLISAVIAGITTHRLTSPISRLTRAAERVTAGDLWIQAPGGRDEIGELGNAFNSMTSELRRTLEGLEHRVAERTVELAKASSEAQHRAKQLETVSEVTKTIASIRDHDLLLSLVTKLISERFGYYHTGIFMIDKASNYAVLRAANSEGGQRMLGRSHRLKVGEEGIVGYVTSKGEPRIAHDVGKDAVFFDNPDLPYTRSEMTLPLKVAQETIGALDVQTMEQAAFSEEDIKLLSMLADQVSLAIENVRLYTETNKALAELQSLHRQYLREAWNEVVVDRGKSGYQYRFGKISPLMRDVPEEVWEHLDKDKITIAPSFLEKDHEHRQGADLLAPIRVRGQVIGYLNLDRGENERGWSDEDLKLIGVVADQVGLAIENARLIEQTRRRAEREHLVSEITTKLRASNNPQQIIETAARELRQALRAKQARVVVPSDANLTAPAPSLQKKDQLINKVKLAGNNGYESEENGRGEA
jgi:GAF domain-containing protein/HAMP domain-containing protein